MGNSWEGLVDGGRIIEDSGDHGELESQYKQGFQTVETKKVLGWSTNMNPLVKLSPEVASLQPPIHLLQ